MKIKMSHSSVNQDLNPVRDPDTINKQAQMPRPQQQF